MKTSHLSSWEEFQECVKALKAQTQNSLSGLLFRGQESEDWALETTLERSGFANSVLQYYELIGAIQPQVRAFTGHAWPEFDIASVHRQLQGYETFHHALTRGSLLHLEYLLYLRHHGFPSPLLDWSGSPNVAAYFAFRSAKGGRVSIFAFCEMPENSKLRSSDAPAISTFGPYLPAHKRHFLQQAEYTICAGYDDAWSFQPHYRVFEGQPSSNPEPQDALWKITLPATERTKVLKHLNAYNLHAFSLFGSEESLMEMLAIRETALRDDNEG